MFVSKLVKVYLTFAVGAGSKKIESHSNLRFCSAQPGTFGVFLLVQAALTSKGEHVQRIHSHHLA